MSTKKVDYYTILQVQKKATVQQIKKAYKKLAIKWHPDKNLDNKDEAVQKFREISQAYQILSNQQKRNKYDLYGFNGPNITSGSSTRFNFNDANDLFKTFFSSYGFENNSDKSFFDAYLKAYAKAAGATRAGGTGGTTYYTYTSKPTDSSSYYSKPTQGTSYTYSSNPSSHSTYYKTSTSYPSGSTYYPSQGTQQAQSSTQNQQLPPEGQTIRKVSHVTRKFTNGTEETIQRTTIISSDGSKQITQQNLDGTNKKIYYVLGVAKKTTIQTKPQSPPKSANFSGYNFGKRQPMPATNQNINKQGQKQSSSSSTGTTGGQTNTTYRTYYTTSSGSGGYSQYTSSSYKNPSDTYANIKGTYSGGTKVYYADGSEGIYTGGSFGNSDDYKTKVYYTVRK